MEGIRRWWGVSGGKQEAIVWDKGVTELWVPCGKQDDGFPGVYDVLPNGLPNTRDRDHWLAHHHVRIGNNHLLVIAHSASMLLAITDTGIASTVVVPWVIRTDTPLSAVAKGGADGCAGKGRAGFMKLAALTMLYGVIAGA